VQDGSEINAESQSAAVLSNHLTVLAEEAAIAGAEDIRRRRCRSQYVAKAVDAPAFEVHAGKQRRGDAFLALAQQPPGLLGSLYISREQNDARRLQSLEQGSEAGRHFRAVEADDQELADLLMAAHEFGPSGSATG